MRRTGRELTLFSIYGAPDAPPPSAARKPKPPPGRRPVRPLKPSASGSFAKPTRPTPRETQPDPVGTPVFDEAVVERTSNQAKEDSATEVEGQHLPTCEQVTQVTQAARVSPKREPPDIPAASSSPVQKSAATRMDGEAREKERAAPKVVMSFYGDGFLELTPKDMSQRCLGVPFSLRLRLFKAADEVKDQDKVESDASRHISPELNDDGEFVRWSCCGSTDKSVYGCPVASDEQTQALGVDELMQLRPPKLLACKRADAGNSDDVQFTVFDRGFPANYTPGEYGALNAGCRVWWKGYECWATNYDVPQGRWVEFGVTFDGCYLRISIDDDVVDTAVVRHYSRAAPPQCKADCVLACRCSGSHWSTSSSEMASVFIGGYAKYSTSVHKWRLRAGFVGLIACVSLSKYGGVRTDQGDDAYVLSVDVGDVKDVSSPRKYDVTVHRNVFWRKQFPPFADPSDHGLIHLRSNFYHGAHHDISPRNPNSFENVLLSVVQIGEVRIRIEFSRAFEATFGSDHGCRTQVEYDTKAAEFLLYIEQLSHLLVVVVNPSGVEPPKGSFEVFIELSRSPGSSPVSILVHSMVMTSCFPSRKDVKAKIVDVITHEARRSPGEEVVQQAVRHFLSLASQARDSRERAFMESVINRKAVITEKRIVSVFQKLGFYFSSSELHDLIRTFKTMQDDFLRHQSRMEDIPTMSLISPTSTGLYRLPLIHRVSLSSITPSERTASRSPWSYVAIMLNYDLQLLDFIHEGCPESSYGSAAYAQSRYLHGGFVDRLSLQISELPSHVYCVVVSLRKQHPDHPTAVSKDGSASVRRAGPDCESSADSNSTIIVQLENGETLQLLAQFETRPSSDCKWFSLAALYRSRKSKLWRFQALGGSTQAASIHSGLEEMNAILVERHIVQVYEVRISYDEDPVFSEFAGRFSKNIRFGRNGKIVLLARAKPVDEKTPAASDREADVVICRSAKFEVALRIQGMDRDVHVYRHDDSASSLPTVQSICRSILRTLAEHGIKESLQQNPFVAGAKKVKRLVTIRIASEDTNTPVNRAYVFIERSVDNQHAVASLASKIVPTLTMGSRLVSIRKRLQKKKYSEEVKQAARKFVSEVIDLGTRYATVSLRDAKLVPIVRSRAVLRRAMRQRRELITRRIFDAMSESERSRIYSRSGPIRLQQLFRPQLSFSESERELVNDIVEMEIESFRQKVGLVETKDAEETVQDHVEEVWRTQMQAKRSPSVGSVDLDDQPKDAKAIELLKKLAGSSHSAGAKESKKRSFVTNGKGVVTCRLSPGSYSVYVFHTDFFEWTSLAVVFPTVNASGLYGGALSSSAPQEIVIPLEPFKWSYGIQLVDFYQQHTQKLVEGVPILITDKCTSEQMIVKTQADGSIAWDVRKGIYSIRALTENTSIVYSGSKNVVVDGGRYHPPRTIFIPVLLGKTAIQLVVCSASFSLASSLGEALSAVVQFVSDVETPTETLPSKLIPEAKDQDEDFRATGVYNVALNSSSKFQLRPGKYTLSIAVDGFFAYSSPLNAPWNANGSLSSRSVVVLCPLFTAALEYRVIFTYANATGVMDAMLDVQENGAAMETHWAHGTAHSTNEVGFHGVFVMDSCEYQVFTLRCIAGRSYQLRVGSTIRTSSQLQYLSPRVQVYSCAGLVFDATLHDDFDLNTSCYWRPCEWNAFGELEKNNDGVQEERMPEAN